MGPHRPIGWAHRPREEEEERGWRSGGWSWWWVLAGVVVLVVVVLWVVGGSSVLPLVVAGRLPRPLHQGMGRWASAQPVHHHPERLPPGELRVPPHHLVGGPQAGLLPLPRAQLHQSTKHQLHATPPQQTASQAGGGCCQYRQSVSRTLRPACLPWASSLLTSAKLVLWPKAKAPSPPPPPVAGPDK